MKRISLREFQLHPTKYLRELPLVLTQYNIPVATVNTFIENNTIDVTEVLTDNTDDKMNNEKVLTQELTPSTNNMPEPPRDLLSCTVPFCKNMSKGRYRVTTDAGENTKELWMCSLHLAKAQREGAVAKI